MSDDDHYLEAQHGYTAGGSRTADTPSQECGDTYLAGYSAAFDCVLPQGHGGAHESMGGSSWASREEQQHG